MPPKPEVAAPPRKETLDQEASNQLMQLTLFGLLAIIVWFVAVEQPKLDQIAGLRQSVQQVQKQAKELKAKLASTDEEMRRVEKASPTGLQASSMKGFQKEYEQRVVAIRDIVDDVQRQLGVERKQREEIREKDRDVVGQLSQHLKWLDKQVQNVREELDGANRLEKANAMLEGRLPTDFVRPYSRDVDGAVEPSVGGGTQGEGGNAHGGGSVADVQDATGGLVELRHGDFPKLLQDGDSWVVMFYAPWCGHCTAAAPHFQQAALQAPVHFARIDAAAHPDIAQSESITGFPTIRFYSKGRVIRTHDGERTVRELLDFARGEGSTGGPPLSGSASRPSPAT